MEWESGIAAVPHHPMLGIRELRARVEHGMPAPLPPPSSALNSAPANPHCTLALLNVAMAAPAGIGCVLSPACVVQSLKEGAAAACSGLILAGDRLEAIDSVRVSSDVQARPLILGPTGTQVTLSFDRNGTK